MPYLEHEHKEILRKAVYKAGNPGALNFVLTLIMCHTFKANMKYETLHMIYRDFVVYPKNNSLLKDLRSEMADRFTVSDIYAAAGMAWQEFYRRVGTKYEEKKIELNGDVEEIAALVEEINKLEKEVKINL